MFTDARSKTILFMAHCLLNQNSISDGTAVYPGAVKHIIALLLESGIGIVQLPCPELMCLGLDRGDQNGAASPVIVENTRIRKALEQKPALEKLNALIAPLAFQISEYQKFGFNIRGIVGINRSPSCGVETTSRDNREVAGRGVFMEALRLELEKKNLHLKMVGVKDSEPEKSLQIVKLLIPKHRQKVVDRQK
jgi:predicted secreted protein